MRLIASVRLSHLVDTTNSPATQRVDITDYAGEHDHDVIAWTEDMDVSGGVPIREREGIGPWLSEDRLDEWDGLIGYRLDRLFRSQLDYLLWVRDFGDKHKKVIIDTEDGTDTSTPVGRRALNQRAQFADEERQKMSERRSKAANRIRKNGRYGGGLIPFGFTKQRVDDGWILVVYEPYAKEARAAINKIIAGQSANSVVMDMNKRGVPTSRNAQRIIEGREPVEGDWQTNAFLRWLRSPTLKGYVLNYPKKGEVGEPSIVYGSDGLPVRRAAIIDDEKWDLLQAAIGKSGEGRQTGRRSNASTLLLGVAKCAECGGAMHAQQKGGRGRVRRYYECANAHYRGCNARMVPEPKVDSAVNWAIMRLGIDQPVLERVRISRNSREQALAEISNAITDITELWNSDAITDDEYDRQIAQLREKRAELKAQPAETPHAEYVDTGETLTTMWRRMGTQERRMFLVNQGLRLYLSRERKSYRDKTGIIHIRPEYAEGHPRFSTVKLTQDLFVDFRALGLNPMLPDHAATGNGKAQ